MKHVHVTYECDVCGLIFENEQKLTLPVGRVPDGAGGMETEHKSVDICFKCLRDAIQRYFSIRPYEESEKFLNLIKLHLLNTLP
jgi:hypothetical protein